MKKIKLNIWTHFKVFVKFIKKYQWILNLLLSILWLVFAYIAIFIAYPQYEEFIQKNKIPNLNWNWNIEFITEDSNLSQYKWMNDQYDVFLIWAKDEYKWKWEKFAGIIVSVSTSILRLKTSHSGLVFAANVVCEYLDAENAKVGFRIRVPQTKVKNKTYR
jgi:hypothetical protein